MIRIAVSVLSCYGRIARTGAVLSVLAMTLVSGCAKLPLENSAPTAPVLTSDGVVGSFGVEILVLVDDADGDKVTVQLQATPAGGGTSQTFAWTSFFPSGQEEVFVITLPVGQWTISAQARDEWQEESPRSDYDLTVSLP